MYMRRLLSELSYRQCSRHPKGNLGAYRLVQEDGLLSRAVVDIAGVQPPKNLTAVPEHPHWPAAHRSGAIERMSDEACRICDGAQQCPREVPFSGCCRLQTGIDLNGPDDPP